MNKFNTKLISITKGDLSPEELIAYTARVSNPDNQMNKETAPKLLAYLIKHKHWSPFEMVHLTVEITTSRAIAAQILRHRSFSFQEFSQRYSKASNTIIYPARRQDIKNKQNSIDDMSTKDKEWFDIQQKYIANLAMSAYDEALEKGIAKEQARFLLPLNTETTLYMCGSIRSWIHYLELRCSNDTQLEHREIANSIKQIFSEQLPNVAKALQWN